MSAEEPDAASQERALVESLERARRTRQQAREADARAAADAQAMWRGLRRYALPAYLAREARRSAPRGRAVPVGTLPRDPSLDELRWQHEVAVGTVVRQALLVDVPTRVGWRMELGQPAAVCGWFALRSDMWTVFVDPLELVVRLVDDSGSVAELTTRIHPAQRAIDRRWVPWRLTLPPARNARLEFETRSPTGVVDRAWALIGDPVLDLGGAALPTKRRRRRSPAPAPRIALLMPVHDPPLELLERTIASVLGQTSRQWELCVVDDGSTDQAVRERLERLASEHDAVRLDRHDVAQGISAATNRAFAMAEAPYVATLDHDDLLHPEAIEQVGARLAADPAIDVLYTDNDLVAGDDLHFAAALKPGWSPDLMQAVMYTLHLGVYRRELVEEIGGWRGASDGAQDHDLMLRLSERTSRIAHLPRVLAHWRAHAGSAALGELAKPTAYDRGREAIAEHLERTGVQASVERLPWAGRYRVRYSRSEAATIVLPADTAPELQRAWEDVVRPGDRVVVGALGTDIPGDQLVLHLAVPMSPPDASGVDDLLGAVESGIAACAGLVVDDAGRVLAGGVAFPAGLPVGLHLGADATAEDRHPSLTVASNRTAVCGAVALRAVELQTAGPEAIDMVRVTSRLADAGRRVVWNPHVCLTATPAAAALLRTTDLSALLAADRGARPDAYWNPQRRPDLGDESYDESLHENGQP